MLKMTDRCLYSAFVEAVGQSKELDGSVFDKIKNKSSDDSVLARFLGILYPTTSRKQATLLVKTGLLDVENCFVVWLKVSKSTYERGDQEGSDVSMLELKLLAIAFIWMLDHLKDESVITGAPFVLRTHNNGVEQIGCQMRTCAPSQVEVLNESLEQILKGIACFLRRLLKFTRASSAILEENKGIREISSQLIGLLADHNLALSKAVLSQCGMAYAATLPFLQEKGGDVEISAEVLRLPPASLVCALHGFMVIFTAHQIERYHKLIVRSLLPFMSSQEPVLLTLTVRTIALWADIVFSSWKHLDYSLYNPTSRELQERVWDLWETHVEMAKGHLREIFDSLLKLHFHRFPDFGEPQISLLVDRCASGDFEKKKTYHTLQILVDFIPSSAIVEKYPYLPARLLGMLMDQSKSQVCQMTLMKMVQSHWKSIQSSPGFPHNDDVKRWREIWIDTLLDMQTNETSESFRVNAGFIQYIKYLLKTDSSSLSYIVSRSDLKLVARLMIVKSAVDENLFAVKSGTGVVELERKEEGGDTWRGMVPKATMNEAVWSFSSQVLQDVLWLLVHPTKSSTEPLLDDDVTLLKEFYSHNLTNQSPAFRHNVYQWTNRLFSRMRDRLLMRKSAKDELFWTFQEQLTLQYKNFLLWFLDLCWSSFYLDASYSRKNLCLQFVRDLLQLFLYPHSSNGASTTPASALVPVSVKIIDWIVDEETRIKQLMGLFHDSVQMNKDLSLEIIFLLPKERLSVLRTVESASKLWSDAFQFSRSLKSEQYPAAANIFEMLTLTPQLKPIIILSRHSLNFEVHASSDDNVFLLVSFLTNHVSSMLDKMAGMKLLRATTSPIHGFLHCIFALLKRVPFFDKENYGSVVAKLVSVCQSACEIVFPVVKQVAPEGYMPPDSEVVLALHEFKSKCSIDSSASESSPSSTDDCLDVKIANIPVTAQMVVFCSWRIVKEACFILADIVTKYKPNKSCAISPDDIVDIADYITKIVVESRHLGAFEKSFLALNQIVKFLWSQQDPTSVVSVEGTKIGLSSLPDLWIDRVLNEVRDPEGAKRFCLTRRSAGVPRYLEALLTTSPALELPRRVNNVFQSLLQCANLSEDSETDRRSKIHAMNILRYLFRCSAIGQLVHTHVTQGLVTSLDGFNSMLWPVQNASNLLFTAILSRVFGVLPDPMKLTRKNCMSCSEFFAKFPSLYDVLVTKLESVLTSVGIVSTGGGDDWSSFEVSCLTSHDLFSESSSSSNSVLYPVLLLIERLFVTENESKYFPILFLVLRFSGWPLIRIRTLVSRIVPNFVLTNESRVQLRMRLMFVCALEKSSMNIRHGTLLSIVSILESFEFEKESLQKSVTTKILDGFETVQRILATKNHCSLVIDQMEKLAQILGVELKCYRPKLTERSLEIFSQIVNQFDDNSQLSNYSLPEVASDEEINRIFDKLNLKMEREWSFAKYLKSDLVFVSWVTSLVKSTEPFDSDKVRLVCNFAMKHRLSLMEDLLPEYLIEKFDLYTEQCQPSVLKLLSFLCLPMSPAFTRLLLHCCAQDQSESLRLTVAEVLSFEPLSFESEDADAFVDFWAVSFVLLFDDCPNVRKTICEKLSRLVCANCEGTIYSSSKLASSLPEFLTRLYPEEAVLNLFAKVALIQLESAGLSPAAEMVSDFEEESLFEPTELNTFNENFQIVELCADVIGQNILNADWSKPQRHVECLKRCVEKTRNDCQPSIYWKHGRLSESVNLMKNAMH